MLIEITLNLFFNLYLAPTGALGVKMLCMLADFPQRTLNRSPREHLREHLRKHFGKHLSEHLGEHLIEPRSSSI